MKMFNGEIQSFNSFIMSLELSGKESRMRTRFCKILNDRLIQMEEERMDIVRKYSNKDEGGNPLTREEDGRTVFDIPSESKESFDHEYNVMLVEEFVLDSTEERKDMLTTVRDVVLNTSATFSGNMALVYDRWCEILEGINY